MESRRHSGSYAPSSRYYDHDHRRTNQAPLTDDRQSFSARAGRGVEEADDSGQGRDIQQFDSRRPEKERLPSRSKQAREPMAALHVPKTHRGPWIDTRIRDSHRSGLSPTIPRSPRDRQAAQGQAQGSVPDRSPLQRLEGKLDDISKEAKRARMEEAEHRARTEEAEHRARESERYRAVANQSRRVDNQPLVDPSHERVSSGHATTTIDPSHVPTAGRRHTSAPQVAKPPDFHKERASVDLEGRPLETTAVRTERTQDAQAVDASQKFRRASDALRMQNHGRSNDARDRRTPRTDTIGERDGQTSHIRGEYDQGESRQYRHRLRDAGFAGAAAAATSTLVAGADPGLDSPNRRSDRRMSLDQRTQPPATDISRSNDRKLQQLLTHDKQDMPLNRVSSTRSHDAVTIDPVSRTAVKRPDSHGPAYQVPPQTVEGQRAREQVGFDGASPTILPHNVAPEHRHGLGHLFRGHHEQPRLYQRGPSIEEWRDAGTARLTREDLDVNDHSVPPKSSGAWWESKRSGTENPDPSGYDGHMDEQSKSFRPALLLKCGPLLRYTGIRRERLGRSNHDGSAENEIWRGSVMIVTLDTHSSYQDVPTLRLFAQPMDLLPKPPSRRSEETLNLPSELADPITGQIKVSRTGRPLFVKPVDQLDGGVDVSRLEDESGLFETTRSATLAPRQMSGHGVHQSRHQTTGSRSRIRRHGGEQAGKYREVRAARLHADRGVTFWRFNIEIELGPVQCRVAYRINKGPAIGFWVPARGQSMNIMFHSCNGFSLAVDPNTFSGPDPLWRDVLNKHQSKPFHVMLGGGDQIYNDAATRDTALFKDWLQIKNPEHKHRAEFTEHMQNELEDFYLTRYSMWFSQGLFGLANSQIPMVNIWDDHDIIDGFGSYPHHFMSSTVFTGLGAVAFKYYMLFQHQSVVSETHREEASWLLGASRGPYINELSRSVFMFLGHKIAFLGLDCRTERMRDEILSQESYDIIFDRCRAEIIKGETKHLIVLLGVPIAYPRLNFLENILTSRVMDPIKAIGRTGVLGGFVNKFDGGVEILDDLDDHWTAKHHKAERNWFIQELQELAAEKSVRVTILGGDVHLGAVGQFYTKKKLGVPKDQDHRYMPNVISSAIVNTPPPNLMGDVLNKRNKIHHLDNETDEDMIPMFDQDVDGKSRNNLHLLPRRNFCTIREYVPGSTPPPSPSPQVRSQGPSWTQPQDKAQDNRQFPPGSMKRTLSLTGGSFRPGNLVRRLSGSRSREPPAPLNLDQTRRYEDYHSGQDHHETVREDRDSYFPSHPATPENNRPTFHRRPTNLSEKAALKASARGGAEGNVEGYEAGHINLEGGLDIALNMEISQQDPRGETIPYRLLVPALWYEGEGDANTAHFKSRKASLMDRLRGRGASRAVYDSHSGSDGESSRSSRDSLSVGRLTASWQTEPRKRQDSANINRERTRPIGRQANDGTHDVYNEDLAYRSSSQHPAIPRDKEYGTSAHVPSVSRPSQTRTSEEQPRRTGFFSGFRRTKPRQDTYEDSDEYGSSTESDFDSVELDRQEQQQQQQQQQQSQRRRSKTDQFFGINEQQGGIGSQNAYHDATVAEQGFKSNDLSHGDKKKGWKIWK